MLKLVDFDTLEINGKKYLIAYIYKRPKTLVTASCLSNDDVYQLLVENLNEDISPYISYKISNDGKVKLTIDYK